MSDQQEFPDNTTEYTDVEHTESTHHPHSGGTELALPEQNLPDNVYIIPIHNRPFFPAQVLPVIVNEEPWAETLELVSKSPITPWRCFLSTRPLMTLATSTPKACRNTAPW